MATINEINAGFNYVGNAATGGGFNPAVEIDTRPLDKLAQYTFFYNRDKWQQNQKDLEATAKQLADLTAYDLTNAIPKFSKQIRDEYNELYEWARKNNTALDYKTNPEKWMEFQKKKNDILNNIKDGKSQEILFAAGKAAIEKETRPDVKAVMQEELDKEISSKDIRTPFSLQQYDVDPLVLPKVPLREFDVIKRDAKGDILVDRKIATADQKFINETAASMALGFLKEQVDVNSPEFKNLPANVKALKLEESKRRKATGRNAIVDQAEVATMALKEFTDPTTGKIDIVKAKAKNPIIAGIIEGIDKYNEDMATKIAQIKEGDFQDELGTVKFGMNGIDERDYALIDYTDGDITAVDLAKLQLKAKAPTTSYTTDVKELNNPLQREGLRLRWAEFGLEKKKLEKANDQDLLAADGILREVTDIINVGDIPENQVDVVDEKTGKKKRVFKIGDPTILQKFGNVDKDGTTTNVPDEARYNPKTNEIDLVYFKRNDEGNIEATKTGRNIREIKSLNARTWANMVVQRSGSGAGRGEVNEIIQSVITKNGGDLYKIAQALKGVAPNTTAPATETKATDLNSLDPNGFKKEGKNYRYKDGTLYDAKGNIVK